MKNILKVIASGLVIASLVALPISTSMFSESTFAARNLSSGVKSAKGENVPTSLESTDKEEGMIQTITNILLFIIGAVSVIMLIYGGIRYTTSGGNANSVTAAKNTIMYAIIGLVVAILAYAIVNFVVDNVKQQKTSAIVEVINII